VFIHKSDDRILFNENRPMVKSWPYFKRFIHCRHLRVTLPDSYDLRQGTTLITGKDRMPGYPLW